MRDLGGPTVSINRFPGFRMRNDAIMISSTTDPQRIPWPTRSCARRAARRSSSGAGSARPQRRPSSAAHSSRAACQNVPATQCVTKQKKSPLCWTAPAHHPLQRDPVVQPDPQSNKFRSFLRSADSRGPRIREVPYVGMSATPTRPLPATSRAAWSSRAALKLK